MLTSFLFQIKDHRRKQGRRYQLGHILLFSIFALLSGADSYRKVHKFIVARYSVLNDMFQLEWKRLPAYTSIRHIIQGVSSSELEDQFRAYSAALAGECSQKRVIAFDGKVLRGSFDRFQDQKAIQLLSAFLTESHIILAHEEIEDKTNEIPTAQELITALGLSECLLTFDAMHCQKKP